MRALEKRLSALETRLRPKPTVFLGSFEINYTEAWSGCEDESDADLHACDERGPRCRKSVTPLRGPERRSIVLSGPYTPLD